jgi:hypothetical protein
VIGERPYRHVPQTLAALWASWTSSRSPNWAFSRTAVSGRQLTGRSYASIAGSLKARFDIRELASGFLGIPE